MSEDLLVIGADSVIGSALVAQARQEGMKVVGTSRRTVDGRASVLALDLADDVDSWPLPKCRVAVFSVGIGSLDACRKDPAGTAKVNVEQPARLARRFQDSGCFVVLLSTSLVFDGSKSEVPAGAPPTPMTEYARQKVRLEQMLQAGGDACAVVRLTKVFHREHTLLRGWVQALRAGRTVDAFENLVCAPIDLETAVQGLVKIVQQRCAGIWQFSAPDQISYGGIASLLTAHLGLPQGRVNRVVATHLEHVPRYATLDTKWTSERLALNLAPSASIIKKVLH
jgi:dTDP-4-dehydrorhamnose reductase